MDTNSEALASKPEITPEMIEAAQIIFEDWLLANSDAIRENGGTGDTQSLFAALWAVKKNAT
jgi:hypothetical protein